MPKSNTQKGAESELLFKKWLESEGWTVHRAARTGFVRLPNGKSFCQSHDLFGALDILAFKKNEVWAVQMTSQSGRSARRVKVALVPWPTNWRVSIISYETTPDPANKTRKLHWWRVEDMIPGTELWKDPTAVQFNKKEVEDAARDAKAEE